MNNETELLKHAAKYFKQLAGKNIKVQETVELINGLQLVLEKGERLARVNLYFSTKKGFSMVRSGGDSKLLDEALSSVRKANGFYRDSPFPCIGQDEAGKGDYLGPLTVASMYCDSSITNRLVALGVRDSKTLSPSRIREIAGEIQKKFKDYFTIVKIMPEDYNHRFEKLKTFGKNSLDMLAEAHAEALDNLICRGLSPEVVIIDKFCSRKRLLSCFPQTGKFHLELREKAEDHPAVAAASILARKEYMISLELLSREVGIRLKPGSGESVDRIALEVVSKLGSDALRRFAKLHFRNTLKLHL